MATIYSDKPQELRHAADGATPYQLRLSQANGIHTDFRTDATGVLTVTPTGPSVAIAKPVKVDGVTALLQQDTGRYGVSGLRVQMEGNAPGVLTVMPGGTSTQSLLRLYNASDPANVGWAQLSLSDNTLSLANQNTGTGALPATFQINAGFVTKVDGPLRVGDGTAGTPAISFSNDQNTGIILGGTDVLSIVNGGAQRYQFTTAGLYYLSVDAILSAGYKLRFDGSAGGDTYIYESSSNNLAVVAGGGTKAEFATGAVRLFGDVTVPSGFVHIDRAGDAAAALLYMSADAGQPAQTYLRTSGVLRWVYGKNSATESGADAGSNFSIAAYTDAGASIDTPFEIPRAAGGAIIMRRGLAVTGAATLSSTLAVASSGADYRATIENTGGVSSSYHGLKVKVNTASTARILTLDVAGADAFYVDGTKAAWFGGAVTLNSYITLTGNASGVAGSIYKTAAHGINIWGATGSSFDFSLYNGVGATVFTVPTGTSKVTFNGDISIPATKKLYLDGGSDTYIYEAGGNQVDFYALNTRIFGYYNDGTAARGVFLDGKRLYFDSASDTYMQEVASNHIRMFTAGAIAQGWYDTFTFVQPTYKFYFDGGVDTYIWQSSDNVLDLVANGTTGFRVSSSSALYGYLPLTLVSQPLTVDGTGLNVSVRLSNTTATSGRNWHIYSLNDGTLGFYNSTDARYNLYLKGDSGAVQFPNITTTGSAANAYLDSGSANNLLRSTSSLRYKNVLREMTVEESWGLLTRLRPFWYRSRSEADDPRRVWAGLGAEHMDALGTRGRAFVNYDGEGRPDGLAYDRLVAPLALAVTDLGRRLLPIESRQDKLEAALRHLLESNDTLEGREQALAALEA